MTPSSTERPAERYLILSLGATQVLLEPSEVRDIEAAEQVTEMESPPMGGVGRIAVNSQSYPVYDLSSQFDLQVDAPMAGRLCVLLAHPSDPLAVLCDKVDMLELTETLHPVPPAMRLANSPVGALVLRPEGLACQSSATLIASFVQHAVQKIASAAAPEVEA